jgi:hypothetical protein
VPALTSSTKPMSAAMQSSFRTTLLLVVNSSMNFPAAVANQLMFQV